LSETLWHVVNGLKNEFVTFLLKDVLFVDEKLDQFENKFFFGDSVSWDDCWVIKVDSCANGHENF